MMPRLLEERFQLKLKRNEEPVSVFEMTAGPRQPELTSMSGLATRFSSALGLPVLEKTRITGNFDRNGWEQSGDGALDSDLIRVVREQLGLVLSCSRAPVLRLIVSSSNNKAPTEN